MIDSFAENEAFSDNVGGLCLVYQKCNIGIRKRGTFSESVHCWKLVKCGQRFCSIPSKHGNEYAHQTTHSPHNLGLAMHLSEPWCSARAEMWVLLINLCIMPCSNSISSLPMHSSAPTPCQCTAYEPVIKDLDASQFRASSYFASHLPPYASKMSKIFTWTFYFLIPCMLVGFL